MKRNSFIGQTKGNGGYLVVISTVTNGSPYDHCLVLLKEKITSGEIINIFTSKLTKDVFEISQLKELVFDTLYNIANVDYRNFNYNITVGYDSLPVDYKSITKDFESKYKSLKSKCLSYNYVAKALDGSSITLDYDYTPAVVVNELPKIQFNPIDPSIYTSKEDMDNIENNRLAVLGAELPAFVSPTLFAFKNGTHNCALFYGEASTGKSFATRIMASELGIPVYSYNFSAGSDEAVIQGKYAPKEDESGFTLLKSIFIKAYSEGGLFIAEELNYAFANVTGPLNSALDFVKKITLANESHISMHPNFRMVTCINPGYEGTQPLNRALLSRQEIVVRFDPLKPEDIHNRLKNRYGFDNEEFSIKIGSFIDKLNKTLYTQSIDGYASLREIESLIKLALSSPFMDAVKQSILNKVMLNETSEVYNTVLEMVTPDITELEACYINSTSDTPEPEELVVSNIDDKDIEDIFASAKAAYEPEAPEAPEVA